MEFLENNTGTVTAGAYLLSNTEIRNGVQQLGLVLCLLLMIMF